jgi:hypothetical protein
MKNPDDLEPELSQRLPTSQDILAPQFPTARQFRPILQKAEPKHGRVCNRDRQQPCDLELISPLGLSCPPMETSELLVRKVELERPHANF